MWPITGLFTVLLLLQVGPNAGAHDPPNGNDTYPVRLVGGDTPAEGRVEVYFNGAWGSVCGDAMFDSADAAVVCRQLGFFGHSLAIKSAYFGGGAGHVLIERVACRGNESRLTDCDFLGWGSSCGHDLDVGVECQMDAFDVRLGGNRTSKEGRAEMRVRGQWVLIRGVHWTASATSVMCRQLGLHGANVSYAIGEDDDDTWIVSRFDCNGDEVALADCSNEGFRVIDLFGNWNVYVSCQITEEDFLSVRLTGGLSSNQGHLQLYHNGQWGTVRPSNWDESATSVVCRQLGFPGTNITLEVQPRNGIFGRVQSHLLFAGIHCRGDEDKIADCLLTRGSADSFYGIYRVVGIICQEDDDHQVRLVEGPSGNRSGLVQVSFGGQWLAVLPAEGFEASLASVACRQLGFFGRNLSVTSKSLHASGRVDVACSGDEATLVDCPFQGWEVLSTDSAVVCQVGETHHVRLTDGATNTTGRVQVLFSGIWAGVCARLWDVRSATVVCRQLGFGGKAAPLSVRSLDDTPLYLDAALCQGAELTLDECDLSWDTACSYEFAGVACQLDEDVAVRLVDGSTSAEGRVEIFFNDNWVTVYDQDWDNADAKVVCRQLGFNGSSLSLGSSPFGPGSGRVYMNEVNCIGDEETLFDCQFSAAPFAFRYLWFVHKHAAGVVCQADWDLPVRLTGGNSAKEGRIEIFVRGQWGGICHNVLYVAEADVVCRQLGFHNGTNLAVAGSHFRDENLSGYLTSLECRGNESQLKDCDVRDAYVISSHFCATGLYAGVRCQSDESFPVRLVNGSSPASGNVEIFFDGVWGRVCDSRWDIRDATVVCNQLGYDGAEAPVYHSLFGSDQNYLMNAVDCAGNESRLADCPFPGWKVSVHHCKHNAGVLCKVLYGAFGATCPPREAVPDPFDRQRPTIVEYSRSGQSMLPVAWTHPRLTDASGDVVNFTTCRMADGEGASWPCRSGDLFGPTSVSNEIGRKVEVKVDATDLHNNLSYHCTFYVLVKEAIATPVPIMTTLVPAIDSASEVVTTVGSDQGQCSEEVTDTAIGPVTWPSTQSGLVIESFERCPLHTEKAGKARMTRKCTSRSVDDVTFDSVWEEPVTIDCGGTEIRTTIKDLTLVEVVSGNVAEVAELLANLTSWEKRSNALSLLSVEDIADVLLDITTVGSGQAAVAEAVVDVVSNTMDIIRSQEPAASARLADLPSVIKSLEMQVGSTFHALGAFSIQRESVHVETISVSSSQAEDGFSLAVVQRRPEASAPASAPAQPLSTRNTLIGTKVVLFDNITTIPNDESVRTVVTTPKINVSSQSEVFHTRRPFDRSLLSGATRLRGSDTSSPINVTLILYEDDSLFPSVSKIRSSLSVVEGVVSLEIKGGTPMALTEPVVTEFQASTNATTDKVMCVFWDFSLGNGSGEWSSAGCNLDGVNSGRYVCRCDRSTNLAVLMPSPRPEDYPRTLDLISRISCVGSAGSYLLIITIYLSIRKLRGSRSGHIFLQFLFSLLILYSVFTSGVDQAKSYQHICTVVAILLHYLPITAMMWTAIQSRKMYVRSKSASTSTDGCYEALLQSLVAWATPLVSVAMTFVIVTDQYDTGDFCLMAPGLPMYISLLLPIALISAHNLVTVAMTMYHLRVGKIEGDGSRPEPTTLRLAVAVSIWILLTISLGSGFLSVHSSTQITPVVFAVTNCILVLMIICMTFLHWSEEGGCPRRDPASARPEQGTEEGNVSTSTPSESDQVTTDDPGRISASEREEDAAVNTAMVKLEENAPPSGDRINEANLSHVKIGEIN